MGFLWFNSCPNYGFGRNPSNKIPKQSLFLIQITCGRSWGQTFNVVWVGPFCTLLSDKNFVASSTECRSLPLLGICIRLELAAIVSIGLWLSDWDGMSPCERLRFKPQWPHSNQLDPLHAYWQSRLASHGPGQLSPMNKVGQVVMVTGTRVNEWNRLLQPRSQTLAELNLAFLSDYYI
jgi:hypothetical protein